MNTTDASTSLKTKVGIFTILGLLLIGFTTVYVNDRPYWWRPCKLVYLSLEDATGLKTGVEMWGEDNANVPAPTLGPEESVIAPGRLSMRTRFED